MGASRGAGRARWCAGPLAPRRKDDPVQIDIILEPDLSPRRWPRSPSPRRATGSARCGTRTTTRTPTRSSRWSPRRGDLADQARHPRGQPLRDGAAEDRQRAADAERDQWRPRGGRDRRRRLGHERHGQPAGPDRSCAWCAACARRSRSPRPWSPASSTRATRARCSRSRARSTSTGGRPRRRRRCSPASTGPKMLEMAGRVADGTQMSDVTPEEIDHHIGQPAQGARGAREARGRLPDRQLLGVAHQGGPRALDVRGAARADLPRADAARPPTT